MRNVAEPNVFVSPSSPGAVQVRFSVPKVIPVKADRFVTAEGAVLSAPKFQFVLFKRLTELDPASIVFPVPPPEASESFT